jgi:PAS domain S-box-containing protein
VLGVSRDITEEGRAEELLERSRRSFQAVFENSLERMILFDDSGRLVDGNPAICQLLGYCREELTRLTAWDVTPAPNHGRISDLIGALIAAGTPAALEVSSYVQVDDTVARHKGRNGYCTQIGNGLFACFERTNSKSRLNFLELLRRPHTDYVINDIAVGYWGEQKLAGGPAALSASRRRAIHRRLIPLLPVTSCP